MRKTAKTARKPLQRGDRVFILAGHPWGGHAGDLIAYETYGLGWVGWRVKLDGWNGECYAKPEELQKVDRA